MGKRNPNGYGSVTRLSGSRSKPYVIRVTMYDADGRGKQVPIDYAETWEQGNLILAEYNNNPWNVSRNKVTLIDLYRQWEKIKLPKLSNSLQSSLKAAFKHCSKYYGMRYRSIKAYQMQDTIDNCGRGYATQGAIKNLWGHLDRFAFEFDIIDKMYSELITSSPIPETTREPFTAAQIDALWQISDEPWVDTVLIYLYTGFRLNELLNMKAEQVHIKEQYFQGGEKSAAGKGRIVPVHPKIADLVQHRVEQSRSGYFFECCGKKMTASVYHKYWHGVMRQIDANHTPHEARHTFETMLDNAGGNRKCIDMLMGHKSTDVGNRIYNHKTIEQLRETVLLLK